MLSKTQFASAALTLALAASAQAKDNEVDPSEKVLMFIPERIADLFDIVHVGIAVGPAVGAEAAITEWGKVGAYTAKEAGIAWMGRMNPSMHSGSYQTSSFGSWRNETEGADSSTRFYRNDWDIRLQVAPFLAHGYLGTNLLEIGDFFAGWVGFDPADDSNFSERTFDKNEKGEEVEKNTTLWGDRTVDDGYDTIYGSSPAHRLGRGFSNVLFGVWEIPQNWMDVTADQGHAAGFTYGTFRGVGRFIVREVVGVGEILTFPYGSRPCIEPEYPFMPGNDHSWKWHGFDGESD